ncbi:uncharacterized protein LOC126191227 [Schistocerca cancellata]|uniref:uncharacterized protein LOC126191227 n=1 Tax=Schistocerca cancellata TaxID=274614 RepID=UPI0021184B9D|nr:uncharacterized protein LOC126191227 [Schistocerca cancellata]XP_049787989.1 uncharacterized protein LOC126191227 [Schistocerca cancellata]
MSEVTGTEAELLKISAMFKENILTDILKDVSGQSDVALKGYTLSPLDDKGECYTSDIRRIRIEGTSHNGSEAHSVAVVIKALPSNICHKQPFGLAQFYRNEVHFYREVLEKLMAFQKKKNPKNVFTQIPRCYKAFTDGEHDYIVLEDLSVLGFQPAKGQETYNFEHCAEVLKCMAKFHALSFAMKDQELEEFRAAAHNLEEVLYSEAQREWYRGMMKNILNYSMQAVSLEYPDSVYEQKMREFCESAVYDKAIDLVKSDKPHSVILNGDAWGPNFLFLYGGSDEQHIKDLRIIDFQMSRWANPVCDLSFFLYSSTSKEVRDSNISNLLKTYHHSLSEMIQDLGSDPQVVYPYEIFEAEVKQFSAFGFIMSLEAVAESTLDEPDKPKLDLMEGKEFIPLHEIWKFPPLTNKQTIKRLADNVKYAVENGHI